MKKSEIIDAVAKESGFTKVMSKKALENVFTVITQILKSGESVTMKGFGTFKVINRPARQGRNPRSGKSMIVPAKKVIKFKAGNELAKGVK
ncbi:MAG: HU family DNA-binding protein [Lentimicrobiaceae bacterium]|jgi:DNA-binding protein HU-beta|nr:HU family DNA-binding protein [Lentimicrobiaceae bacterium]